MVARYFAYGSNMNPDRVRERGIDFHLAVGARLSGYALAFDKTSRHHEGLGHANLHWAPAAVVEGVLYWLDDASEIHKMDRFERTPVNYSREIVQVNVRTAPTDLPQAGGVHAHDDGTTLATTWTYFANPAVRRTGLLPPRSYLDHLLAGRPYLSQDYYQTLSQWPCEEQR